MIWIGSAGELALAANSTAYDVLLTPGDWSGTVTEQTATLLRMVLTVYTDTLAAASYPHAQNAVVYMSDANLAGGVDTLDISNYNDWPDWFISHDRVLRIFRLEWEGVHNPSGGLPVQFSQLPEPIMNLKTPRVLRPDDTIALGMGGLYFPVTTEVPMIHWYCRSLVRVGLR